MKMHSCGLVFGLRIGNNHMIQTVYSLEKTVPRTTGSHHTKVKLVQAKKYKIHLGMSFWDPMA